MNSQNWNKLVKDAREEFTLPDMPSIEQIHETQRQRDIETREAAYQDALRHTKQVRKNRHEDFRRFPPLPVEYGASLPRRRGISFGAVLLALAALVLCYIMASPILLLLVR